MSALISDCLTVHIVLLKLLARVCFVFLGGFVASGTSDSATLEEIYIVITALGNLAKFGDVCSLPFPA